MLVFYPGIFSYISLDIHFQRTQLFLPLRIKVSPREALANSWQVLASLLLTDRSQPSVDQARH